MFSPLLCSLDPDDSVSTASCGIKTWHRREAARARRGESGPGVRAEKEGSPPTMQVCRICPFQEGLPTDTCPSSPRPCPSDLSSLLAKGQSPTGPPSVDTVRTWDLRLPSPGWGLTHFSLWPEGHVHRWQDPALSAQQRADLPPAPAPAQGSHGGLLPPDNLPAPSHWLDCPSSSPTLLS